ncbi:hypothetical protein B0J17DRAFT_242312 [Rhizoctonia solani]|nr:hypothetical protein B0J17DRAFT_242312 [Rhizoctonia solani]
MVIYGSLQVTETVDSESGFDDLDLDCIHIPIEDWVESMGSGWYRARLYIEMKYGTMTYYVGRRIFHRGHGGMFYHNPCIVSILTNDYQALIAWIYRDISPLPEESQVQNTRPQPVVRPGHSIYKPSHSPCNPATDHRMECIQSQEHLFDEIEPEVTREQKTEAEQEAEQKLKRRTRRGGKKYHERKQRKLEPIAGNGDPECGDEEMPED